MKNNQKNIPDNFQSGRAYLLILIVLCIPFSACAEESKEPQTTGLLRSYTILGLPLLSIDEHLVMGLGVGFSTNPFKGVNNKTMPFPEITYQNGNFTLDFNGIGYTVYSQEGCEINLLGSWRSAPYDSTDSAYLKGMENRNFVIEGGVSLTTETPIGSIGIVAMSDVTNNHKGQSVAVQYSLPFGSEDWAIEPVIGVNWESKKVIGYYYGVRHSEVRDDRAFYDGKSTFTPFIGLNGGVKISANVYLQGGINYEFLGSGITDSPLIDDSYVLAGSLSLSYSF